MVAEYLVGEWVLIIWRWATLARDGVATSVMRGLVSFVVVDFAGIVGALLMEGNLPVI